MDLSTLISNIEEFLKSFNSKRSDYLGFSQEVLDSSLDLENKKWSNFKFTFTNILPQKAGRHMNLQNMCLFDTEKVATNTLLDLMGASFSMLQDVEDHTLYSRVDNFKFMKIILHISYQLKKMMDTKDDFSDNNINKISDVEVDSFATELTTLYLDFFKSIILEGKPQSEVFEIAHRGLTKFEPKTINPFNEYCKRSYKTSCVIINFLNALMAFLERERFASSFQKISSANSHPFISDHSSLKKQQTVEIYNPHPLTNSSKETKRFIELYLENKGESEQNNNIKFLLKGRDRNNNKITSHSGYQKTLGAFFFAAIDSGIIKSDVIAKKFLEYLKNTYQNDSTRLDDLRQNKVKEINSKKNKQSYLDYFTDLKDLYKKYIPTKEEPIGFFDSLKIY